MVKHALILRGYDQEPRSGNAVSLSIIARHDSEFIPGLLEGLRGNIGLDKLGAPDLHEGATPTCLHLYQPVHRAFNLALVEIVCDRPGFPRLDAKSIESAGLVVRRVGSIASPAPQLFKGRVLKGKVAQKSPPPIEVKVDYEHPFAWKFQNEKNIGWRQLDASDVNLDPDPARRPLVITANKIINERLAKLLGHPEAERVAPLFIAPPEVCEASKRTLLYGVIPVTSTEQPSTPDPIEVNDSDIEAILPAFLKSKANKSMESLSGITLTAKKAAEALKDAPNGALASFVQSLRMMQFGWRTFDEKSSEGKALFDLLNKNSVNLDGLQTFESFLAKETDSKFGISPLKEGYQPLGNYLADVCAILFASPEDSDEEITLPAEWPEPINPQSIRVAVANAIKARLALDVSPQRRFDDAAAVYVARAFVRIRCRDGCPPKIEWSNRSLPFTIAPWWETGKALHTIVMPDPDDAKKITPNVAFQLPPKLAALLNNNSPTTFLTGTPSVSPLGIGWICSFNIPIITICAFIVLNIFLQLLNIVFQWIYFIKICLPVPKPPPRP